MQAMNASGSAFSVNAPERLSDAFIVYFGPSSGPEVLLFKRFQDKNGASSTTMSLNPEQLQHQVIKCHSFIIS